MTIPDRDHPIWPIIRQAMIAGAVGFCLWFNYDSVDSRDLFTILTVSLVGGATEGLGRGGKKPSE